MFTKEHFEEIASIISSARKEFDCDFLLDELTEKFADTFAKSNERFSRKAFIGACRAVSKSEIRRLVQSNNKRLAG